MTYINIDYWRPAPATEAAAKEAGLRKGLFEGRFELQQSLTFRCLQARTSSSTTTRSPTRPPYMRAPVTRDFMSCGSLNCRTPQGALKLFFMSAIV